MSDNETIGTTSQSGGQGTNRGNPADSLIAQVMNELDKGRLESIKNKVKEKIKAKVEHEVAIRLIDAEVAKIISDFKNGVV